jgi:outer membrane protein assembly factor BamB
MGSHGLSRRIRVALAGIVTGALIAAIGVTVWRVLRPSEVSTPAITAYPESDASQIGPGKRGVLVAAPLIIDDRLRIFAKKREVWADGPPSYHYERSAFWSYRRWPAQLAGVVVTRDPKPIVVSTWSDGVIVGIDAETGKVAWRIQGDVLSEDYTGRRTGAPTVYSPPGLYTTSAGFVTSSKTAIRGYSAKGTLLWEIPPPVQAACHGDEFTSDKQFFLLDTCTQTIRRVDGRSGLSLSPFATAVDSLEPVSCVTLTSQCRAVRTSTEDETITGWLLADTEPAESEPLAQPGALLANDVVAVPDDPEQVTELIGYNLASGEVAWRWLPPAPATLLVTSGDRIVLLLEGRTLATVSAKDGADLSRSGINLHHEPEEPYAVSAAYASNQYIVLERINEEATEESTDDAYYFTNRPILVAVS